MLFKAPLACEQAVYGSHILASANRRDFLMELAFQVIYISLVDTWVNRWSLVCQSLVTARCRKAQSVIKHILIFWSTNKRILYFPRKNYAILFILLGQALIFTTTLYIKLYRGSPKSGHAFKFVITYCSKCPKHKVFYSCMGQNHLKKYGISIG